MNRKSIVPVFIALLSISALGVAATTLETTVTTEPADEIDPEWDRLPIEQGDAATIREEIEGADGDGTDSDRGGEHTRSESEAAGQSGERSESGGSGFGIGTVLGDSALFGLLMAILRALVSLLAVVALVVIGYRYRAALRSLLDFESAEKSTSRVDPDTDDRLDSDASNVVDRAWLTLLRQVGPERPETTTTAECRTLARERELDTAAVEAITTAFERVHYGEYPIASEADRARLGLRRLEGGFE